MPVKTFLKHIAITYIYSDEPLTCSPKGPTLLAPPVPDLYHDPIYCILHETVGRWWGGYGSSILVRPVHVLGSNSRATREATVSSNSSPIAAAAAVAKPYSACDKQRFDYKIVSALDYLHFCKPDISCSPTYHAYYATPRTSKHQT